MDEFDGFEWDEQKSERCFRERQFDFEFAARLFHVTRVEWEDKRSDHGETRFVTVGEVDARMITVVWTPRNAARRIISARPASRHERKIFDGEHSTEQ